MKLVGYGSDLAAAPGKSLRFMVSSEDEYEAQLVRPSQSAALREELDAPLNGRYPGRVQPIPMGSYVAIDRPIPHPDDLTLSAWIWPTLPTRGEDQELIVWDGQDGLFLNERGEVELRWAGTRISTGVTVLRGQWYRVSAGASNGQAYVAQEPVTWGDSARVEADLAYSAGEGILRIGYRFDGKIEAPAVAGIAEWDFSVGIQTLRVEDKGPQRFHGEIVNLPMRGVTGHNWTGEEVDFRLAPQQYAAIHFHSDDMSDCTWESDFSFEVPSDLVGGLYAIRLRSADAEDYIPFFVKAETGKPRAKIAFLAPTFSYLAYSNEHFDWNPGLPDDEKDTGPLSPADHFAHTSNLHSAYDFHLDGTGNCFVTRYRPHVNMRPYYSHRVLGGPHQLPADLYVLDWLRSMNYDFDVITDDDLHEHGADLLRGYSAVLTGTHPEYWSGQMLDGLELWVREGGKFVYLGGNGFYWVTVPHPEAMHVVEIRRTNQGTRAWESLAGEFYTQGTAEHGGLWKFRGRAPQRYVGVGMSAHGHEKGRPYLREPDSFDPHVSWIFDGIGPDEEIGDFGVTLGAAAGFELDRLDSALGSPPNTFHLATASGFHEKYQWVVEEVPASDSRQSAKYSPNVRADLVYFETPGGGAVFSTGSITWGTSLTHNDCDNNVSRITDNVLKRFSEGAQ